MDLQTHITRRLALLPDEKLLHLMNAMNDSAGSTTSTEREAPRVERLEVISRELRARGILGPPWWSGTRR